MSERRDDDLDWVVRKLEVEAPQPAPGFRARLHHILEQKLRPRASSRLAPQRVRVLVAAWGASGICLLAIAAIGVAGAGPLAA